MQVLQFIITKSNQKYKNDGLLSSNKKKILTYLNVPS